MDREDISHVVCIVYEVGFIRSGRRVRSLLVGMWMAKEEASLGDEAGRGANAMIDRERLQVISDKR